MITLLKKHDLLRAMATWRQRVEAPSRQPRSDHKAEVGIKTLFSGPAMFTGHIQERMDCFQAIQETYEENEHAFPTN